MSLNSDFYASASSILTTPGRHCHSREAVIFLHVFTRINDIKGIKYLWLGIETVFRDLLAGKQILPLYHKYKYIQM